MSYITTSPDGAPGAILTITGNVGGAVPIDGSGNINVVGTDFLTVVGNVGTNTLEVDILDVVKTTAVFSQEHSFTEELTGTISSDGTTVVLILTTVSGADPYVLFTDGFHILTMGSSPETIVLTPGTDSSPVMNYLYFDKATLSYLVSTTGWPTAEHAKISELLVPSASRAQTKSIYSAHNYHTDVEGHIIHMSDWIREQHATWQSGVTPKCTITTNVGAPDNVLFSSTDGKVLQLHKHDFPAITGTPDIYVVNGATAYTITNDLNTLLTDSSGSTMSEKYFSLVIWGVISPNGAGNKLMLNLPSGSYTTSARLLKDTAKKSDYSIPTEFKGTGFLIARLDLHHSTADGGTWTLERVSDLRGLIPSIVAGGGTPQDTQFLDTEFAILDDGDVTSKLTFEASPISTGTTRTIIMADRDIDMDQVVTSIATDSGAATPVAGSFNILGSTGVAVSASGKNVYVEKGDIVFNTQTSSYTLVLDDNLKMIVMNSSDPTTVTIPTYASVALSVGSEIMIYRNNATVMISPSTGVTLEYDSETGKRDIKDKYMAIKLIKTDTDKWILSGNVLGFPEFTWTDNSSSPTTDHIYALTYNDNTWVIGDQSGGNVYITNDPTGSWTEVSTTRTGQWDDAAANDDYWTLIGGTDLYTATDPYGTWTQLPSDPFGSIAIRGIAYSSKLDMWFIGGDQFKLYSCGSDPSGTWTARSSGVSTTYGVKKVAAGDTYVVAVGSDGYTSVSSDGTTWTVYHHTAWGTDDIQSVAYGDGIWVYGGGGGNLYVGSDPTDTSTFIKNTSITNDIGSITYSNGVWFVGHTGGDIYYTYDPYGTWKKVADPSSRSFLEIVSGGGYVVGVGYNGAMTTAPTPWRDVVSSGGINVSYSTNVISINDNININTQTGTSYTTTFSDSGKYITMDNASASTLTIPPASSVAYPIGTTIYVQQLGAGQVTLTPGTGVTFRSAGNAYKLAVQYSGCSLTKILSDTWSIMGDVAV